MIKISGMKKTYIGDDFEVKALDNISLDVGEGEFLAVMGASGSGKTTLLNCIGLLDGFDEGSYTFNGEEMGNLKNRDRDMFRKGRISFIFQDYSLMRNYTLYENIELPLLAANVKKRRRRQTVEEAAEQFGIADILKKKPYQVSGGQQQRAAIVRAIVADTPLILADEPTGALDSGSSRGLMEALLELKKRRKTVIMVTHDEKMAAYGDRIIFLEDGRVVG